MYENLFNLIDDLQKAAMKIKVQEVLNALCTDERVHEILDADIVLEYYEKMYEHFEKNHKDFLFPNREWLRESLKRLNADVSEIFNKDANVDHIKREEVIVLFMLLWVHMVIQNPIRIEVIKDPYDLFYIWTKNRVFIARPTETHYLQDRDRRVLDRLGKSYGWFTGVHHFSIGVKGTVEYMYSSPDDITNINGAYNKAHGSVTKLRVSMDKFEHWLDNVKKEFDGMENLEIKEDFLKEQERCNIIRSRNTKFVVREMSGWMNKRYKEFLREYKTLEQIHTYPHYSYYNDIIDLSGLDDIIDKDVILESMYCSPSSAKDLVNTLLKLKEKLNERN